MTARIFAKLIFAVLSLLIVALTTVDFLTSEMAEKTYVDTLKRELAEKGRMLNLMLQRETAPQQKNTFTQESGPAFDGLARAAAARLTWVAADGTVIADSEADASKMENHRHRPELMEALAGREGSSIRKSPTLGVNFLYVAIPAPRGALRLAVPLSKISSQVNAIRWKVLASTALAFIPAILIAALFARYVSARLGAIIEYAGKLAQGDFGARLKRQSRDELGILSSKLNETGEKLQHMFEQLQKEHVELEKLERIRKDFVINVSHELRTPLASIQGYTETLLDGAIHDPEHNVRFLSIIRQNAERLARLTGDLLTLSRIELKTQKFQFASYYVNALLSENVDSMLPMAEKKRIKITLEPAPPETEVFCDSQAVQQILSNLMDNAVKYTPEGGAIYVGARVARNDLVEIYVRDTGMGIPAAELPRLFERFYRVDKARSRELGGTGLGLAIVKHLSRAQGGEVRVESTPNRGSTFYFTLPVHDLGLLETGAVQPELAQLP
ncbi:MAG TPA: ATP-binding protein [Bryobacteraceae bacterium]|nr:ATP-binding protein [Bryobacteraceae bacterium]